MGEETEPKLPSARQCLAAAVNELTRAHGDVTAAEQWIAMAREIREGSAPALPPLIGTIKDVEGIICAHGQVVVRWKDDDGEWRHVDSGLRCTDPDEPGDEQRRRSNPPSLPEQRMQDDPTEMRDVERTKALVMPMRDPVKYPDHGNCVTCGYAVTRGPNGIYRHDVSGQRVCPTPVMTAAGDETYVHTFAFPAMPPAE